MLDFWLRVLLAILVFPGLIGAAIFGWFLLWLSRKFVARLQGRQGPPFFQPFFDFWKLVGKKTIIPRGTNPVLFYALPVISLISVIFALAMLPVPGSSVVSFPGDLVLMIYLLEMPAFMDILAGFITRSVYGQVGSVREALLSIAYNLPFIGGLVALAIKLGSFEMNSFATASISVVTILAALALFMAVLARLKVNPFSIPNAEQEIVAGVHVEYNGLPLALFELTHALEVTAMVGLIAILFLGPATSTWLKMVIFILVSILVILAVCLAAAGTARLKVQHAFRFYWVWGAVITVLVFAAALIL